MSFATVPKLGESIMALKAHLYKRGLRLQDLASVRLKAKDAIVTFLLYDLTGRIVGTQTYRPLMDKKCQRNAEDPREQRYFTRNYSRTPTAWGLETLDPKKKVVFVTEGIFDCVKFHNSNRLAMLCNVPSKNYLNWLFKLPYTFVAVCDGDGAGRKMAKHFQYAEFADEGKDPGDMPLEWFEQLEKKYERQLCS